MSLQSTNKKTHNSHLSDAIEQWQQSIGSENVRLNDKDYSTTTFDTTQKVIAAILPKSTDEVSSCLLIANKHKIPIYPVSGGKNFGLGSKIPISDQSVVMDLQRMTQISDYNEDLAYITVEPGVTFKQLETYLQNQGSKLMMDSIGGTPYSSIIGNTVERGHGMGLYASRFDHTCALKVVRPTGEVINTGFGSYKENKITKITKQGVGPSLDGLFTQSNFGIVTQLTFWLKPKPSHFQSFLIHIKNDADMGIVVDRFRKMRLEGLRVSLRIFNDYRMIAFSGQYYDFQSPESKYLSRKDLDRIKPTGMGKWIAIGGLYSYTEACAKADRAFILESLSSIDLNIVFWDKPTADKIVKDNPERKEEMDFFFYKSNLLGYTTHKALNMCYWRMREVIPENKDIHKDKCGLLWYCPVIPCKGEDALIAHQIIEETSYKHHLEPNIGFLFISERTLDITGAICFDKTNREEMSNATKCHDEIMEKLIDAGYPPYRLGIQSMQLFEHTEESTLDLLEQIKKSIDPNNILANKRYNRL